MDLNIRCKNYEELEALKLAKMGKFYPVKAGHETVAKDVDFSKRIVKAISNTFYWIDEDQDMLITGSTTKTVREHGPNSTGKAKIKNVKDHQITRRVGKPLVMEERSVDGKMCQYTESKMLSTTDGTDTLIEYQEEAIDQHSIGFRYVDLEYITADSENWNQWRNQAINPEKADEYGYFFIVKEIEQFEWSPVSFGSNELTPYLGVKSGNKESLMLKIYDRIDILGKFLYSGTQSDDAMRDYELQQLQLKQVIQELFTQQPSLKQTLIEERRVKQDTQRELQVSSFDLEKAIRETNFSKFLIS